jgi:tRNA-dihydrouridine synthase
MAPMVAASDYAFRCLVERHGADLTFTQMLHARNLVEDDTFARHHLDFPFSTECMVKSQRDCIEGMTPSSTIKHTPGPLMVQLAGHNPDLMLKASSLLLEKCDLDGIDVNFGCPQGIARKGNYGAFLLEHNVHVACDILTRLKRHFPHTLVSCKIRLPLSLNVDNVKNRILQLQNTGIDFITVHGRTLEENKTKTLACHTDLLQCAVETAEIPVIANGGIERHDDIQRLKEQTGAAAVMSSEALLETPNLFQMDSHDYSPQQRFRQQMSLAREYIQLCASYPPLPGVLGGFGSFQIVKGHLFKMLHRYLQQHADIREQLTCSTKLRDALVAVDELERRYDCAQIDWQKCPSSQPNASWYRRHWEARALVHQRGREALSTSTKTIQERKNEMKTRIARLRQERLIKNEVPTSIAGIVS